jgi:hypothetical protein
MTVMMLCLMFPSLALDSSSFGLDGFLFSLLLFLIIVNTPETILFYYV